MYIGDIFLLDVVAERAIFILSETSVELLFIWDVLTWVHVCILEISLLRTLSTLDCFLYWL